MSSATIDRYLRGAKAKPSPLLRSSIKVRKDTDEIGDSPGFFEGDTVADFGPDRRDEFARTVNLTDMRTGWVFTCSLRINANTRILGAPKSGIDEIHYEVTGLGFGNGTAFLCGRRDTVGKRSLPPSWAATDPAVA